MCPSCSSTQIPRCRTRRRSLQEGDCWQTWSAYRCRNSYRTPAVLPILPLERERFEKRSGRLLALPQTPERVRGCHHPCFPKRPCSSMSRTGPSGQVRGWRRVSSVGDGRARKWKRRWPGTCAAGVSCGERKERGVLPTDRSFVWRRGFPALTPHRRAESCLTDPITEPQCTGVEPGTLRNRLRRIDRNAFATNSFGTGVTPASHTPRPEDCTDLGKRSGMKQNHFRSNRSASRPSGG